MDVSLVDEQLVLHSFLRIDLVILTLDLTPLKQLLLSLYTQCTYMYKIYTKSPAHALLWPMVQCSKHEVRS